jgi:hypothetical protein
MSIIEAKGKQNKLKTNILLDKVLRKKILSYFPTTKYDKTVNLFIQEFCI